jgi:hypothetical protein
MFIFVEEEFGTLEGGPDLLPGSVSVALQHRQNHQYKTIERTRETYFALELGDLAVERSLFGRGVLVFVQRAGVGLLAVQRGAAAAVAAHASATNVTN